MVGETGSNYKNPLPRVDDLEGDLADATVVDRFIEEIHSLNVAGDISRPGIFLDNFRRGVDYCLGIIIDKYEFVQEVPKGEEIISELRELRRRI